MLVCIILYNPIQRQIHTPYSMGEGHKLDISKILCSLQIYGDNLMFLAANISQGPVLEIWLLISYTFVLSTASYKQLQNIYTYSIYIFPHMCLFTKYAQ